jgi:tetratricopeptide (TPR) repeat protein
MARRQDHDGFFTHPLAFVRAERNWSYQDLVNVIARHVGNMATRREKAWRWENWGVVPDEDSQYALARELGVPRELVRRLGWPTWLPAGDRLNVEIPWTPTTALSALDHTAGAAVLDRRAFLTLSAGTAVTVANQWLSLEAPRVQAALRGGTVDTHLVEALEQRLPTIRQMQYALGGGSVRNLADAELRLVTDLLSHSSYTQQLGGRLFNVAAELGRVAGWSSFDAGLHASAERYFIAALRASHAADDRAIGANILKCMSLQLVEADRPDEALAIATTARDGAKQAPPRIVAMMTVREARAHAVLGETVDCERLLVRAEAAMARADEHESPGWAGYFDQAEYCAQVAACYLLLRRHRTTDYWLSQSLELQPAERTVDRATYLMWRADTTLELGDVDHACSLVGEAVPSIASARSARNRRRLLNLQAKLNPHQRHPAVARLDEQVRSLIA